MPMEKYLVGGAVRDHLLGLPIIDTTIVAPTGQTSGAPLLMASVPLSSEPNAATSAASHTTGGPKRKGGKTPL